MNISFSTLKTLDVRSLLRNRRVPSAPQVLTLSWWLLFAMLLCVLALDGWLFYRYGLGTAPVPEEPNRAETIRVREESIREAAAMIRARQEAFSSPALPADLPNPFR